MPAMFSSQRGTASEKVPGLNQTATVAFAFFGARCRATALDICIHVFSFLMLLVELVILGEDPLKKIS
jgi:hypothetical protein